MASLIDRLRGRNGSGSDDTVGLIKMGGNAWSARWNFTRTLESVYSNPTARRCVERIASDFQRPAWELRERGTDNAIPYDEALDAYRILRAPRPGVMTGTQMQYLISRDLDLTGGTFWLKLRGQDDGIGDNGPVSGLRHLASQRMTVVANADDDLIGFVYVNRLGQTAVLFPDDVVYVHYPHPDRVTDRLAPAVVAGLSAETDSAAVRFNFELLSNDSALPGYLMVEGLNAGQFRDWKAQWDGADSPGRTRFLSGSNAKYVKVGQTNQELMYNELRTASHEDICRSFGMAKIMVDPTDATFANLLNAKRDHIQSLIDPRWTMVGDDFTTQLGDDLGGFDIGFNLGNIEELQEGLDAYVARAILLVDRDIVTPNQVREDLKLDPVPWGDTPRAEYLASIAVAGDQARAELYGAGAPSAAGVTRGAGVIDTKALTVKSSTPPEPAPGFDRAVLRHETSADRAMVRFFERQGKAIAARYRSGSKAAADAESWFDEDRWKKELAEVWSPLLGDSADAVGGLVLATFDPEREFDPTTAAMGTFLEERSTEIANLVNDTTKEQIRGLIDDELAAGNDVPGIVDAIRGYFSDDDGKAVKRATTVARTEVIGAANFAALEAARQTELPLVKRWLAASDAEEDCQDLNGHIVDQLDGDFTHGDVTVSHPPLHPRCRCTLTFDLVED